MIDRYIGKQGRKCNTGIIVIFSNSTTIENRPYRHNNNDALFMSHPEFFKTLLSLKQDNINSNNSPIMVLIQNISLLVILYVFFSNEFPIVYIIFNLYLTCRNTLESLVLSPIILKYIIKNTYS